MVVGGVALQSVSELVGVTIDGVAFGLFLALLGVGITLVFGLAEVLNLAIGTFAVIGGIAASVLAAGGMDPILAGLLGVALVGVLGVVVDLGLLSLVYRSEGEEQILLGIFTTLGLTILLDGILFNTYPDRYRLPLDLDPIRLVGVQITPSAVVRIAISVVILAALFLFLRRTFLGRATRTVFQDEVGALLVGVEPRRIRSLVFVLSSVVAGIAGVLFAASSPVRVVDGFQFTTFGLIVSIVGGVRSVRGAVGAGIFLGLVIQFASFYIGSYQAQIILFLTAVAAILYDPEVLS
jgi:branched-chain amino acid transport system permease protein